MNGFFKKTIVLMYLAIFLFGLFAPLKEIAAQSADFPLTISTYADPTVVSKAKVTVQPGKDLLINANVYNSRGQKVFFKSSPSDGVTFSPANTCITGNVSFSPEGKYYQIFYCHVFFKTNKDGKFNITASTELNGKTVNSNSIEVTTELAGPPVPPVILSANPSTVNTGEPSTITATFNSTKGGQTVSFSATGGGNYFFSPPSQTCAIPKSAQESTKSCSIIFGSYESGNFLIKALVFESESDFKNKNPLNIDVSGVNVEVKSPYTVTVTPKATTDTTYEPLAPLPGFEGKFETDPDKNPCPFGKYLNIMIKIIIGFAAVLAMVMIITGGIEYMTSELVSSKEAGKETVTHAVLGLLIALGAFLILNTINPQLLSACLDIKPANITITNDFDISGALNSSFSGKPIKVNFNAEAYPAAKTASQRTGVETSFILAIFSQETASGASIGKCKWNDAGAKMKDVDKIALQTITKELSKDINDTPVSCALSAGYGGAIGYTQFLPSTWLENRDEAKAYLGHTPNPWNTGDALMMTAVYLKKMGGISNQKEAACKYFAGPNNNCGSNAGINNYGNSVMGKKLSIQQQIDDAIKNGKISL